jgi:DNA repair protein RecO (recombination protein O)
MSEKIFVLRVIPYRESDIIIHGLTSLGSKIVLYARGAKRSKKRFGGGILEPTHYLQVHYEASPRNPESMLQLKEASLIEDFPALRENYERLDLALYFVSMVDRISKEGMVHSEGIFDLLGNSLRSAETSQALDLLKLHFELKLLALQGELPFVEGAELMLQTTVRDHEKIILNPESYRSISSALSSLLNPHSPH